MLEEEVRRGMEEVLALIRVDVRFATRGGSALLLSSKRVATVGTLDDKRARSLGKSCASTDAIALDKTLTFILSLQIISSVSIAEI